MKRRMDNENKRKKTDLIGICLLGLTIMILGSTLYWLMSFALAVQEVEHDNTIEELNLEKAIALISNKDESDLINNKYELDLIEALDKIKENCGDTFITKKYGSNEYSVFLSKKSICDRFNISKEMGVCYIPVERCFNGK